MCSSNIVYLTIKSQSHAGDFSLLWSYARSLFCQIWHTFPRITSTPKERKTILTIRDFTILRLINTTIIDSTNCIHSIVYISVLPICTGLQSHSQSSYCHFWQLLLRNGRISSKSFFLNRAGSDHFQAIKSFSSRIIITSNQLQ